tara:strand:- start:1791 stop:1958 length:168 start_codon:yes stop_codon:yes gene_type:complete
MAINGTMDKTIKAGKTRSVKAEIPIFDSTSSREKLKNMEIAGRAAQKTKALSILL